MTYSGSPSCNSGIRKLKPVPFRTPQAVSSSTFSTPPLNGSLSLPEICDYHRLFSADHPLFVYDDESEDFDGQGGEMKQTITWGHAVRAVHTMARLTEGSIRMSDSKKKCTVVAVLASLGVCILARHSFRNAFSTDGQIRSHTGHSSLESSERGTPPFPSHRASPLRA